MWCITTVGPYLWSERPLSKSQNVKDRWHANKYLRSSAAATKLFDFNDISFPSHYLPPQNSGSCNSFYCIGHFRNVYDAVAGFCNGGGVKYGSIGGLEYEVPLSRLYCLCINVALCSTALQCICRVIRRSSMTMKAHTYYIIFGCPPIGGSLPLPPWRRHCCDDSG